MEKKKLTKAEAVITEWLKKNVLNRRAVVSIPIWKITQKQSDKSVKWVDHDPNPRFTVYDPQTPDDPSDDLVLDKETGLVWARDANLFDLKNWLDSNTLCREFVLGDRIGWRLPTVEELSSLVDRSQSDPALAIGHPFVNVQYGAGVYAYWSSTNSENPTGAAWFVNMGSGGAGLGNKSINGNIWPVRGGIAGNNWNW